jgi:hypothetical protein
LSGGESLDDGYSEFMLLCHDNVVLGSQMMRRHGLQMRAAWKKCQYFICLNC